MTTHGSFKRVVYGLFKRDEIWHFDFQFRKRRYQGTTRLKNLEKAKMYVSKVRSDLALGLVGLALRPPAPLLEDFLRGAFMQEVNQNVRKPRTRQFYFDKIERLLEYKPFQTVYLDGIDELAIQAFKGWRAEQKRKNRDGYLSKSAINGELRTLRKALIFARNCKLISERPLVRTLPGETQRTFTLTGELENAYLAAASYPLREVAILMLDLGLRTDEVVCLKKTDVTDEAVTIWDSKTPTGRRAIPQTDRTREVFQTIEAFYPEKEYVFPGRKGHLRRGTLDNLHTALRDEREFPAEFVLYSCRHTFGTRLAESGASAFEIKEAMGHKSITTSEKYIHPSSRHLTSALKRKELLDRLMRGEPVDSKKNEAPVHIERTAEVPAKTTTGDSGGRIKPLKR